MWTSDHSPYSTNSVCSRWPIAVIPKSLYLMEGDINATIAAATREIVAGFNRLSTMGIKIRDFSTPGRSTVARTIYPFYSFNLRIFPSWFHHVRRTCWYVISAAPAACELRWLHCISFVLDLEETGKPMARCLTSAGITTQMRHGGYKI